MLCFISKLRVEYETDTYGAIKSPALIKHIESCDNCRRHYHSLLNIEDRLRAKPAYRIDDDQLDTIQTNISKAIRTNPVNQILPRKQHKKLYTYALPAAAIIILLLSLSILFTNDLSQKDRSVDRQKLAHLISGSDNMADQFSQFLTMPENSVESEVNNLISNAKRLVSFL